MKICVSQTQPVKGDISANVAGHKSLVRAAVALQANTIFFPELSLTGYEPELAKGLAIDLDDKRLNDFQQLSNVHTITIGLGAPTKHAAGTLITMVIFQPEKPRQVYSKQQLHSDEFPYFISGNEQIMLTVGNLKVAPAICYESLQAHHAEQAKQLGAEIYVASVAKSRSGVEKAQKYFPLVAAKHKMPVLMANCIGHCDNFDSVGESSVWNADGTLIGQLDSQHEGLLIFDTVTGEVSSRTF